MKKGYIMETINRVAKTLLLLFICLVSCQDDKDLDNDGNEGRFMILPVFHQNGINISTKALIANYHEYQPENGELIYAWAHCYSSTDNDENNAVKTGEFRRSNGGWYSSVEVKSQSSYRLFAFNPGGISNDRGTFGTSNGNYTLSVSPISTLTLGDPSISIAATRSYWDYNLNTEDKYTDPTPVPGNFDLGTISSDMHNDKALLAMNHLYAKASLKFKMNETYADIRTIVIKGIKIRTSRGQSGMDVTFAYPPVLTWSAPTTSALELDVPIDGDSIILSNSYQDAPVATFCYLPVAGSNLPIELEVQYDVYHSNATFDPAQDQTQWLIREGQHARNARIMPSATPAAGTDYPINIIVNPTYLYQLSDDDAGLELIIE